MHLRFKRPWSDGTTAVSLEPLALIARLAAIVPPPPKRHVVRYFGVLSSHRKVRRQIVPTSGEDVLVPVAAAAQPKVGKRGRRSKYIPRREVLKRTFGVDIACPGCQVCLPKAQGRRARVHHLKRLAAVARWTTDRSGGQTNSNIGTRVPRGRSRV